MHPYRHLDRDAALPALPLERVGKSVAACAGVAAVLVLAAVAGWRATTRAPTAPPSRSAMRPYKVADVFRLSDDAITAMRDRDIALVGVVREVAPDEVVLRGAAEGPEVDCSLAVRGNTPPLQPGTRATFRARLLGRWHNQITADHCVLLRR